jgi:hypothetical protein
MVIWNDLPVPPAPVMTATPGSSFAKDAIFALSVASIS